jgi:hypothetical protein
MPMTSAWAAIASMIAALHSITGGSVHRFPSRTGNFPLATSLIGLSLRLQVPAVEAPRGQFQVMLWALWTMSFLSLLLH